jgi:hypothetical protein
VFAPPAIEHGAGATATRSTAAPREHHAHALADEITAPVQKTVLEREMALLDSEWVIAESGRLLKQTQALLDRTRRSA